MGGYIKGQRVLRKRFTLAFLSFKYINRLKSETSVSMLIFLPLNQTFRSLKFIHQNILFPSFANWVYSLSP